MTTRTDSTTTTEHTTTGPHPAELGVGARFSLHPHCDDFVDVILGALAETAEAGVTEGLVVETDDVSSYVGAREAPAEQRLAAYLTTVTAAAARRTRTGHLVAHVLLSRGCPGETTCDLSVTGLGTTEPVELPATGVQAAAQWSLYPLLDATGSAAGDAGSHMHHIEAAIDRARQRGTAAAAAHYATRLSGDLADVVATAVDAWAAVGSEVPHVVAHLTLSIGSPTAAPQSPAVTS